MNSHVPVHTLGQFGRNLTAGIASLVVNILSGFVLTPFLVSRMGLTAYGLIPLVLNLVNFLSVVNIVLNAALGRHVSLAASQGDHERASRVFNTALWASLASGAIVLVAGIAASGLAPRLVRVAPGNELDASLLFVAAVLTIVGTLCSSPFSVAIFYVNRLDILGRIVVVNRALYVALAFLLAGLVSRRPAILGIALVASAGASFVQTVIWWRRFLPWLKVSRRWDPGVLLELLWFGWWALVSHGGTLLLLTIDLIVVNRLIGPEAGGVYAALILWAGFLRAYATTANSVVTQPMAQILGRDGEAKLLHHAMRSVRIMGILLAAPVAAVSGLAFPLLLLWLGPGVARYSTLLIVLTVHLSVSLALVPLVSALQTVLRIRALGILTLCCGLLNVAGSVALVRATTLGMLAVAIAGAISLAVLNLGVVPMLAARRFGIPLRTVLWPVPVIAIATASGFAVARALCAFHPCTSWMTLLGYGLVVATSAALLAAALLLSAGERRSFFAYVARVMLGVTERSEA